MKALVFDMAKPDVHHLCIPYNIIGGPFEQIEQYSEQWSYFQRIKEQMP